MVRTKKIKGIIFRLYCICRTKKRAYSIAYELRRKGYYIRLIGSRKGIEIWIAGGDIWRRLLGG